MRAYALMVAALAASAAAKKRMGINCYGGRYKGGFRDQPIQGMINGIDEWLGEGGPNYWYKRNELIVCDYPNKGEKDRSNAVYCASWKWDVTGHLSAARQLLQELLDYGCHSTGHVPINGGDDLQKDGALGVDVIRYDYYRWMQCPNPVGLEVTLEHEPRKPVCAPLHVVTNEYDDYGDGWAPWNAQDPPDNEWGYKGKNNPPVGWKGGEPE